MSITFETALMHNKILITDHQIFISSDNNPTKAEKNRTERIWTLIFLLTYLAVPQFVGYCYDENSSKTNEPYL